MTKLENYKAVLSLMPKASEIRLHFSYSSRRGQFSKLFFPRFPLLLYCTTFLFYCSLVFRATNASYVFYMYCVIHLELQSNFYNQKKGFLSILKKPRFDRNFKRSFSMKYSVIKIFQFNVDES